jgi:hypothetical protein
MRDIPLITNSNKKVIIMGLDINVTKIAKSMVKTNTNSWKDYEKLIDELNDIDCENFEFLAYFRKVNFLFEFFSGSLNEEETTAVITRGEMEELIEKCEFVLNNRDKASEILPTCDGFFFGSLDYDDYYFESVAKVLLSFQVILENYSDDYLYIIDFSY